MTTMSKPLSRAEVTALAADLEKMLAAVEEGGIDATLAMRHRLEGAFAVLEVALGRSPRSALGLLESR